MTLVLATLHLLPQTPLTHAEGWSRFVNEVTTDPKDAAIIESVVALGHGLELKVIAEGVETAEQLNFLRLVQCDGMQGYFFSRPLPVEAAAQCIEQTAARTAQYFVKELEILG